MTTGSLFLKRKLIEGNHLRLLFHKDYPWIFNTTVLPVVSYLFTNCRDINAAGVTTMEPNNEGFVIETTKEQDHFLVEITDAADTTIQITCEGVEEEEQEYSREDLVDLIKEGLKQRDAEHESTAKFHEKLHSINSFLQHELDVITRKLNEAAWMANDKRQFLQGQQAIIEKIIAKVGKD